MTIYINKWACPYCKNVYTTESAAQDCADDCVDVESPDEVSVVICEMCEQHFDEDIDAEACEQKHKDNDDRFYQKYLTKKNFELLDIAAKHPEQKRLI